ncbi:MAG TPA: protein translocase subunit SecD [Verrucomicrobiae bacterium]|nr:protein translocase subunit SecD [Verrucomicrobiae bacterium]
MRQRLWITFVLILVLTGLAGYIAKPSTERLFLGTWNRDVTLRQGLDLKGGAHLEYEADTSKIAAGDVAAAMDGVREVFESRVNTLGVTEPEIRTGTSNGKPTMIVDLPGVSDISKAKEILGSTAVLDFRDAEGNVVLEGKHVIAEQTVAEPLQQATGLTSGNQWQVRLTLNNEGKDAFAEATAANTGKQIGIYLDNQLISNPTVNQAITDGVAIISGNFTAQDAKDFALQLKSGALPVPVTLVQEQTVGATLGSDAISRSIFAGAVGLLLILLYMIAYYRWCGVIASLALIVYSLLNIALFKFLPVTMTLAGIAAFIISIGIAIDTNVLTFERLKEELRQGKPLPVAVNESFRRAWTSIRDSHLAGLISAFIIFIFASGPVRGFAVVLIIGTLLSLFTAITVVRNWMLLVAGSRFSRLLEFK